MELRRESDVASATRGKVSLPFAFWALAWSVLLTVLGLAMSIGIAQSNITTRLGTLEAAVSTISSRMERHADSPGHMVAIERINALGERVEKIEAISKPRGGNQ